MEVLSKNAGRLSLIDLALLNNSHCSFSPFPSSNSLQLCSSVLLFLHTRDFPFTASPLLTPYSQEERSYNSKTHPKDSYTSNNCLILLRCQSLVYTRDPFRSGGGGRGHGAGRGRGALRWHGSLVRLSGADVGERLCRTRFNYFGRII